MKQVSDPSCVSEQTLGQRILRAAQLAVALHMQADREEASSDGVEMDERSDGSDRPVEPVLVGSRMIPRRRRLNAPRSSDRGRRRL